MLERVGMRRLGASILALLLSFATAEVVSAQSAATITGRITNETGQPLFGAGVGIEALAIRVGTDEDGRYTITVPGARVRGQQVVLQARLFGYAPQVKSITLSEGSQTHDFVLRTDVNRMTAVVVTGVAEGTEKTKVPFTIAQVTAEDMPVPGANAFSQLQGKVAGMQISSSTGRPGADPQILLRAPLSINASGRGQQPLVIVDGIIFQGGISDVNPQDIESVEVVKGAAAASLYGSRAGNGVIQITTKRGKGQTNDGIRFNVSTEYGASDIERDPGLSRSSGLVMNEDYSRYCVVTVAPAPGGQPACTWTTSMEQEIRRVNDIVAPVTLATRSFIGDAGISSAPTGTMLRHNYQVNPWVRTYEPVKQMLTNGAFMNTNVSMSGRIAGTNVFGSVSNLNQAGSVLYLDGFDRNGFRLNADQQVGENWSISGTSFFSKSYSDGQNFVGGNARPWFSLSRTPAFANILGRDSQGRLHPRHNPLVQGNQNYNPLMDLAFTRQYQEDSRFLGSLAVKYRPFTWADAEWNFGYDYATGTAEAMRDKGFRTSAQNISQPAGFFARGNAFGQSLNTALNVTMRRQLTSDLNGSVSLRYLYEQQDNLSDGLSGGTIAVAGLRTASATTTGFSISSGQSTVSQIGLFATGRLDYMGKLIFDGLVRRDGASVFGIDNRWQTYGRASILYRPSEEAWWFAKDVVNEFKLRAAYGTAGNRPIFSAQYETLSIGSGGTLTPATLGNPLLGPEVVRETDIGFDAELFNRYGVEFSVIKAVADDQILLVPISASAGFSNQWRNAGTLTNDIVEGALNVPILEAWNGVSWSTRVAFDMPKSKITQLDVLPFFTSAAGAQGTAAMFFIGEGEDFGNINGVAFVTSCREFPAAFQARCGEGKEWQKNDDGFVVWVGQGNTWREGITKNLWNAVNPASDSPWGATASRTNQWGMPMRIRNADGTAVSTNVNGSAIPSLRWSMGHNVSWNKVSGYVLFDAIQGRSVFNLSRSWNYGDLMNVDIDQNGKSVETAKPIGYYWRAGSGDGIGLGGLYDALGPSNLNVEDASFVKLRELSVGYRIGRLGRYGDWSVNLIGRNLLTWSDYKGFDPETGLNGGTNGSGILNAVDGFNFPGLRTVTMQFNVGF